MSRMYKATGDKPILEKATHLMREWGKTIELDGYFYYSRRPMPPHYTYDKTVCGLVNLYHYGGQKDALPLMEKITDWAVKNLDRSCQNPTPEHPDATEWYAVSENVYRAYRLPAIPSTRRSGMCGDTPPTGIRLSAARS